MIEMTDCPQCDGTGVIPSGAVCWKCGGSGEIGREVTEAMIFERRANADPIERRKRGRPPANATKEGTMPAVQDAQPPAAIQWWTPIERNGGGIASVRFCENGKIAIAEAALSLIGKKSGDDLAVRVGCQDRNTIVFQFFSAGLNQEDYPWRLNQDRSLRSRPVEMLHSIDWQPGRYRVEFDYAKRLLIVRRGALIE